MNARPIFHRGTRVLATLGLTALLSIGAVSTSGAATKHVEASTSAFCTQLLSYKLATVSPSNTPAYKAYVVKAEAYYSKLAGVAPNASVKSAIQGIVTILKAEAGASSAIKFATILAHDSKQFGLDLVAFEKAAVSCAISQL